MKEQFGIRTEMFLPIPAWSQGFLFGMLNKMGLTTYNSKQVPTGDPNVLRTAMMRDIEGQSLLSDLKITFETSYEQKYIDGVDPGLAFQDIIGNLTRCGTSDMKFILGNSETLQKLIKNVSGGSEGSTNAWIQFGKELVKNFIEAINDFFNDIKGAAGGWGSTFKVITEDNKQAQVDQDKNLKYERDRQILVDEKNETNWTGLKPKMSPDEKAKIQEKIDDLDKKNGKIVAKPGENSAGNVTGVAAAQAGFSKIYNVTKQLIDTVLAGSVYKYRWPLIGSIGLMSGISTTPWHLTVGNPFSPILNLANIYVNNVDLKFSNEMGFNDMPKRVDATIEIKLARPLGSSEINRMFNNQYGRIYSKSLTAPNGYHYDDGVLVANSTSTAEIKGDVTNGNNIPNQPPTNTVIVGHGKNKSSFNTEGY